MSRDITNHEESSDVCRSNWVIVALLAAILATQILTLIRMPAPVPTMAAVRNAKTNNERVKLLQSIPLARVHGGTVDVEVQNTPLEVEVYR